MHNLPMESLRITRDIDYLGRERAEKLDLYQPIAGNENGAGIVIIHGGGWQAGDKADEREQNMAACFAGAGYTCVSVNYKMGNEAEPGWPQCLLDCQAAVRFLRANAVRWGIPLTSIGAIGGSAGGHLAAMLGVRPSTAVPSEPSDAVQAVADFYGPNDLLAISWDLPWLFGKKLAEAADSYRDASPAYWIKPTSPPFFLAHGTADALVPVEQSHLMVEALQKVGVESELEVVEGAEHSFHLQPEQKDLRPQILAFFDRHLLKSGNH